MTKIVLLKLFARKDDEEKHIGRPTIDPEPNIRMVLVGYVMKSISILLIGGFAAWTGPTLL